MSIHGLQLQASLDSNTRAHKWDLTKTRVNVAEVTGLVYSGCSQILLWESLVEACDPSGSSINLQCIHRNVHPYHMREVQLKVRNHTKSCFVGLSVTLAYPVILGSISGRS